MKTIKFYLHDLSSTCVAIGYFHVSHSTWGSSLQDAGLILYLSQLADFLIQIWEPLWHNWTNGCRLRVQNLLTWCLSWLLSLDLEAKNSCLIWWPRCVYLLLSLSLSNCMALFWKIVQWGRHWHSLWLKCKRSCVHNQGSFAMGLMIGLAGSADIRVPTWTTIHVWNLLVSSQWHR